ncbi:MAG: hypothetical protein IJW55_00805 [Clostridia bacterium]|nr:hypothetical protein [Clostridia bacterium]
MKEIGGYFGFEQLISNEYYPDLIAVNNARNALLYLLKAKKIKKLYIPYFLCDSVSKLCDREGYRYEYYHIGEDFLPIFEKSLSKDEYLYIVNFYGQISNQKILDLKKIYGNIIFDNVQAFFQRPVQGIDTIYSCRKFFGVPDGGYISTTAILEKELPVDISKDRMKHILGRFEGEASEYYEDFKSNDRAFVELELRQMSALTHNILGAIDYDFVCERRNKNYAILEKHLGEKNKLHLVVPTGPYCYPFYCENGMEIKKRLAKEKIFVATLWPNVLDMKDSLEKDYAENILPLPCDQRYHADDMIHIVEEVVKCIN